MKQRHLLDRDEVDVSWNSDSAHSSDNGCLLFVDESLEWLIQTLVRQVNPEQLH